MKYLFICALLIFSLCSCLCLKGNKIHWTQEDVKEVLVFDTISMSYILSKSLHCYAEIVNSHKCPSKGERFGLSPIENLKSIVVKEKTIKGYTFKLLCSSRIGENDTPIKSTILHIYKDGKLCDCIVLSLDFIFEVEHFARFIVSEDKISIDRYEINHSLYDEDNGSIIGAKDTADTTVYHNTYNIINGHIEKFEES